MKREFEYIFSELELKQILNKFSFEGERVFRIYDKNGNRLEKIKVFTVEEEK